MLKERRVKKIEKKIYQQVGGECTRTSQQVDAKEAKQFWNKIWQQREHNRQVI